MAKMLAPTLDALPFDGRGNKHVIPCATETEALAAAQALANEYGRPALVSATKGQASAVSAAGLTGAGSV